ncbi:MAG: hypothetical protein ACREX3_03055 [Gammaproteobacteria bacterium]
MRHYTPTHPQARVLPLRPGQRPTEAPPAVHPAMTRWAAVRRELEDIRSRDGLGGFEHISTILPRVLAQILARQQHPAFVRGVEQLAAQGAAQ